MFDTEREGIRDWVKYLVCVAFGHKATRDGDAVYCSRCQDVIA